MAQSRKLSRAVGDTSEFEALQALAAKVGGFDKIESFKREGMLYVASIKVADDDEDSDSDSGDSGGDNKPAFLKSDEEKDEGDDSKSDSDDEDSSGDDDRSKPPFAEKGEGDEGKPSLEGIFSLVKQIAEAVGVPVGGPDDLGLKHPAEDALPGPDSLDLPDVGAPPEGGPALPPPVPAPAHGGPAGPHKPGAMPSFARVAGYDEAKVQRRVFDMIRGEAGSVSNSELMREAALFFPDHRVAKIDRQKLGESDQVVVTLAAVQKLAPGKEHMKGVSDKRNRQYEHIKEQLMESGKSEERAKEEAARTVNKQRAEHGETKGD